VLYQSLDFAIDEGDGVPNWACEGFDPMPVSLAVFFDCGDGLRCVGMDGSECEFAIGDGIGYSGVEKENELFPDGLPVLEYREKALGQGLDGVFESPADGGPEQQGVEAVMEELMRNDLTLSLPAVRFFF
jgi:hypothetical protein